MSSARARLDSPPLGTPLSDPWAAIGGIGGGVSSPPLTLLLLVALAVAWLLRAPRRGPRTRARGGTLPLEPFVLLPERPG